MINLTDYHVHTTFSDGNNTPEEMVKAAIEKGLTELGFSDHSYTCFDESCCIKKDRIREYKSEIARLKAKYSDKIKILCGLEQDFYSAESTLGYDYAIGSVHYVKSGEQFFPVDESAETFEKAVKDGFSGDVYAFIKEYFNTVAKFAEREDITIIGHFDLISKFNEKHKFFDENDTRYISAWQSAADKLLAVDKVFEINTGAIARGYKTTPYPSEEIREYIKVKGGKFVLSSDSHDKDALCFRFNEYGK